MSTRLASLALTLASLLITSVAAAQDRCDCNATHCQLMTAGGATVRGRIVEATGRDANDRVERYFAIVPERPVCAEVEGMENPARRHTTTSPRLQLVITDAAIRTRVRRSLGRVIALRGTLSERITAHHHTPLLLDVTAVIAP